MAQILVIARLCEPSSGLHLAEGWYRRTAMEDLLGVAPERVNDDRLYRALETQLKQRMDELFTLDYELLLYAVTSTYFEGQACGVELARRRGHSRDHRPDCKQVCSGLVVTREGMPLGYAVFAGNRTNVTTVEDIAGTMEARYGAAGVGDGPRHDECGQHRPAATQWPTLWARTGSPVLTARAPASIGLSWISGACCAVPLCRRLT